MDPLVSPGLIPVGDSPNSSEKSSRSPRRAGSFSFRNIGRKTPSPSPKDSTAFPFEDTNAKQQDTLSRKSSSGSLKSPRKLSFKIKNVTKEKEKVILGEMESETGRSVSQFNDEI